MPRGRDRSRRATPLATGALAAVLVLGAACGDGDSAAESATGAAASPSPSPSPSASPSPSPGSSASGDSTTTSSGDGADDHAPTVSAADLADEEALRVTLERLLGHHALLDVRTTRDVLTKDSALVEDAKASLVDNTAHLKEVATAIAGDERAVEFEGLWSGHIEDLVAYATATVEEDPTRAQQAREDLDEYRRHFARRLSEVTNGAVAPELLEQGIGVHLDAMLGQVDAYAAGDYARAFALEREAYAQMFPLATVVAKAFAAARSGAPAPGQISDVPAQALAGERPAPAELRSALGRLLGEHAGLAVDVMRSGVRGSPDFEAAAGALAANSDDLTAAADTVWGPERAAAFNEVWAEHIDLFVDYTVAVADGDRAAEQQTAARFDELAQRYGGLLSEATGGALAAQDLVDSIAAHEQQLLDQVKAFADGDLAEANRLAQQAYDHMFGIASALAGAVEQNLVMPVGGAQTGGGGLAGAG